jgi:transposase
MSKNDGRKLDHKTSEQMRLRAVRAVREGGETPSAVMKALGLCRTAIYPWLRKFDKSGEAALKATKAKGPQCKLTLVQREEVRSWIIGKDPRQYGFDFALWTRKIISKLIAQNFEITLELTAVKRLLDSLNLTPQKPLRRAYERKEEAVLEWKKKTYPKLKLRAKRLNAKIFFLDEAGFSSEPNLERTYGLRGETPVVRTSGKRQKVNVISAVTARGEFWSDVYTGMLTAERFVWFLKKFHIGRYRKVFLIVDGHPAHRAKIVKKFISRFKGRVELHFLPPYAPDLNPDEFVWSYAKKEGLSKKPLKKNEQLKDRVEMDMANIKKNKRLVRSFFKAKSVVYAKD